MKKPIRTMLSIQATPDISSIRTAQLLDQDHTVIPCIALVEGVLWPANAPGPELALAEEFGRFPQGWNGRPVTYDHPKIDGHPVSASSPDVLKDNSFGQLFNTELKDGKLHTEIWINEARIAELGEEAQATVQGLKDGTGVAEVSTGLFTMSEPVGGEYNGREYESIWRNIVPDHLAVLPEGIKGACSVADGCGAPRLNMSNASSSDATEWQPVMRAAQMCSEEHDETAGKEEGIIKRFLENALKHFSIGSDDEDTELVDPIIDNTTNSNEQENAMNEKLVNDLITNEQTQFTEDDREWLSTLEEGKLEKLVPAEVEVEAPPAQAEPAVNAEPETEVVAEPAPAKAVTTKEYIAQAPAEIQVILNSGVKMHQQRKDALVKGLLANKRCTFTEDQLNGKSIDELEQIAAMAPDVTFEGNGTTLKDNSGEQGDDNITPAPNVFDLNPAANA